jgi:hypothetical protein
MVYRKDWGQPAQGGLGFARTMKAFGRKVNLTPTDLLTTSNVVGLFMLPENFVITGMIGPAVPAFGAGLTFSIGDTVTAVAGNVNRYLSASTIGAAGGALPAMAATGLFARTYAQPAEIQLTVTNGVAAVAGVLELYFTGFIL